MARSGYFGKFCIWEQILDARAHLICNIGAIRARQHQTRLFITVGKLGKAQNLGHLSLQNFQVQLPALFFQIQRSQKEISQSEIRNIGSQSLKRLGAGAYL